MSDIEQIEVVRGPGAVMWGPNAVNGMINVITKKAQQTKGAQVTASAGNETRSSRNPVGRGSERQNRLPRLGQARRADSGLRLTLASTTSITFSYRDPSIRNLDTATGRMGFRVDGTAQ